MVAWAARLRASAVLAKDRAVEFGGVCQGWGEDESVELSPAGGVPEFEAFDREPPRLVWVIAEGRRLNTTDGSEFSSHCPFASVRLRQ